MYVWIWRRLPGGGLLKFLQSLVLVAGVVVLLFLVVFPWAERNLPFNDVTVDRGSNHATSTPGPAGG